MTDFVPYEPGTIEVTNGSKNIVGTGTDFSVYSGGDTIWVDGYPVLLDGDPSSDTAALAKYNYLGTSGSGKSYRWVPLGDLSRAIALDTRLSSYFTSGNLSAEAGLTGAADVISYYTGVGTKAVTAFTAAARTVLDDTTVAAMRTTLFDVSTTVDNRIARYDGTAGALQNSAITVDDSGNVSGVGTLAAGAITSTGNVLASTGASAGSVVVRTNANVEASARFQTSTTDRWVIGKAIGSETGSNANADLFVNAYDDAGAFLSQPILIQRSSGLITFARGQLAMPATQNPSAGANTWDDYEEGTWTPSDGSGAGLSFTVSGNYTKTGNRPLINGTVSYPSTADGTAHQVNGLPFSSVGNVGLSMSYSNAASERGSYVFITGGTSFKFGDNTGGIGLTNAQLTTAAFYVTGHYSV